VTPTLLAHLERLVETVHHLAARFAHAREMAESLQPSGLTALTVLPWAPNFNALRRVSSNFERM
jgi:hypothetical protein